MRKSDKEIVAIIIGLADLYDKTLSDFTISAYMEIFGGYDPVLVRLAAKDCVTELGFMPRPVEILNRIEHHEQAVLTKRSIENATLRLPEPKPNDEDRVFGSFVCKAMSSWIASDFIKGQREAGTFIDYDHSLFVYMAEQKMDQEHINRLAGTYPRDPREER